MASSVLFKNMDLLDPRWDAPRGGYEVLVEGATIKEVSNKDRKSTRLNSSHTDISRMPSSA